MRENAVDQLLFTFSDFKRTYLRYRFKIWCVGALCGLIAYVFLLFRDPVYEMQATFKQSNRQSELSSSVKEMFQQVINTSSDSSAIAIIQSDLVLKGVVEDLGLQVICDPDSRWVESFKNVRDHLLTECGRELRDLDPFIFSDVIYEGEKPLKLFLKLTKEGFYQCFDDQKKLLAQAKIGEKLFCKQFHMTLKQPSKKAECHRFYPVFIQPWGPSVARCRSQLKIIPHKLDRNVLKLTFTSRNRFLGAQFLNGLMQKYKDYLKRENDHLCHEQLKYLKKRRDELTGVYNEALSEHACYLKENLSKNGFVGFAEEIATLSEPKNLYISKLFDVDLELNRLNDVKINLSQPSFQGKLLEEIAAVKTQIDEAVHFLQSVEMHQQFPSTPSLLKEPKTAIALLVKQMAASVEIVDKKSALQDQNVSVLKELIGQLEQKKGALEENARLREQGIQEFSGLNLGTAQSILAEYTRSRDAIWAQMREMIFFRDQIAKPDFEMSSLGGVFEDGVTRDLVAKASMIALQLQDEHNRSPREQERLLETLQTQKKFLSHYLFQTIELKRLKVQLFGDKIASLQQTIQHLLQSEKEVLNNKLQELNTKMGDLPDKWQREALLELKKEMSANMLGGVIQLTEAKHLGQLIFQVGAGPLDLAFPAIGIRPPKILMTSFVLALFAALCSYFFFFCKSLMKGFPVSDDNLRLCGFPVIGKLSAYCDSNLLQMQQLDLETLRRVAEFLTTTRQGSMVAVSIGGAYPSYINGLAELLAMRSLKVIVVQCVFDQIVHPDEMPGLFQYLQGDVAQLPIRSTLRYDFLPSGIMTRFGAEVLRNPKFQDLVLELKQRYDLVLLCSNVGADTVEGLSLYTFGDAALITVQQETKEQLLPYTTNGNVTFLYAEEFS